MRILSCLFLCLCFMFNTSAFPEKVYIISLDRTSEHLNFVKDQLNKQGIQCTHFHLPDGRFCEIIDTETQKIVSSQEKGHNYLIKDPSNSYKKAEFIYLCNRKNLTPRECNRFLSHRAIWLDIIKNQYQNAIIFEDNIILHSNFKQNFKTISGNIPYDTDIFFLDIGMVKPSAKKTYFVSPGYWLSCFSNTDSLYYAKLKKSRRIWGFHAYCITLPSAKKLLQLTEFASAPIDTTIINLANELNLYVSKIKLVSGNYFNSETKKSEH